MWSYPHADPLILTIKPVGDPDGAWALLLEGTLDSPDMRVSIRTDSVDGIVPVATRPQTVGLDFVGGQIRELIPFPALNGVGAVHVSLEVADYINQDVLVSFLQVQESQPDTDPYAAASGLATPDHVYVWDDWVVTAEDVPYTAIGDSWWDTRAYQNAFTGSFIAASATAIDAAVASLTGPPAVEVVARQQSNLALALTQLPGPGEIINYTPEAAFAATNETPQLLPLVTPALDPGEILVTGTLAVRGAYWRNPWNGDLYQVFVPCPRCPIQIWDSDGTATHDLMTGAFTHDYAITNVDGTFSVPVLKYDDGNGGIDPYVVLKYDGSVAPTPDTSAGEKENDFAVVKPEGGNPYVFNPGLAQATNCPTTDGATCDLGQVDVWQGSRVADNTYSEVDRTNFDDASHIWVQIQKGYARYQTQSTFDEPPRITVLFPNSADTSKYTSRTIYMHPDHVHSRNVIQHEYGHYIMNDAFQYTRRTGDSCPDPKVDPYSYHSRTNEFCAWREGWATAWSLAVYDSPVHYAQDNHRRDYETPDYDPDWVSAEGWDVEARIAAFIWDMIDSGNDGEAIDYALMSSLYDSLYQSGTDETLEDFYDSWVAEGYSSSNFKTAANHNRIWEASTW